MINCPEVLRGERPVFEEALRENIIWLKQPTLKKKLMDISLVYISLFKAVANMRTMTINFNVQWNNVNTL